EPGGERDHREAGPDRQLVIEPEINHQHGGGLPDHRQPAQPNQRIEAYAAPGPVGFLDRLVGHADNVRFRRACSTAAAAPGGSGGTLGCRWPLPRARRCATCALARQRYPTCPKPPSPPSPLTNW